LSKFSILQDDLSSSEVLELLQLHLDEMYSWSPPETVHALPAERLREGDVTFYSAWHEGELAAIGALKSLGDGKGEIKSMRAAPGFRGKGAGRAILAHLLDEAQRRGYHWLGLETGRPAPFQPALRLYESFGFNECEPFAEYASNDFSICLSKTL
jgi:putative acetyltransferase